MQAFPPTLIPRTEKNFTTFRPSSFTRRRSVRVPPIAEYSYLLPPVGVWAVSQSQCVRPPSQAGYPSSPRRAFTPPSSWWAADRSRRGAEAPFPLSTSRKQWSIRYYPLFLQAVPGIGVRYPRVTHQSAALGIAACRSTCMVKTRRQRSFWARIKLSIIFSRIAPGIISFRLSPLLLCSRLKFFRETCVSACVLLSFLPSTCQTAHPWFERVACNVPLSLPLCQVPSPLFINFFTAGDRRTAARRSAKPYAAITRFSAVLLIRAFY